jgi:hypothetical protein
MLKVPPANGGVCEIIRPDFGLPYKALLEQLIPAVNLGKNRRLN